MNRALSLVSGASRFNVSKPYLGALGPNMVGVWHGLQRLQQRGLFDMQKAQNKEDEGATENALGWFFTYDLRTPCAAAGDIGRIVGPNGCMKRTHCHWGNVEKIFLGGTAGRKEITSYSRGWEALGPRSPPPSPSAPALAA